MSSTGIILPLAYPDTIVSHAEEWYSPFLKYLGVGSKSHVRAGHAALVLIDKSTGILEYHDFGRYITPSPNGRVRGKTTDNELDFPVVAKIENDLIANLDEILEFLATHPKLTHGDGKLVASVCNAVDYKKAREYITMMQNKHFIRYAAFIKIACNCARFVTDALIASVTDENIKKKLIGSKWFTPSTVGNVLIADTQNHPYEVSEDGVIEQFTGSQKSENLRCFLDKLKNYEPSNIGTIEPKENNEKADQAQWLSGIAAGAWFELYESQNDSEYRFRRISPYGHVDCDALFKVENTNFRYNAEYQFVHYSNCSFIHIEQNGTVYKFNRIN